MRLLHQYHDVADPSFPREVLFDVLFRRRGPTSTSPNPARHERCHFKLTAFTQGVKVLSAFRRFVGHRTANFLERGRRPRFNPRKLRAVARLHRDRLFGAVITFVKWREWAVRGPKFRI